MTVHASDGLRWGAMCTLLAITGCPQVADDDFALLAPSASGGTSPGGTGAGGGSRAGAGGSASIDDCNADVGVGGRCANGTGGAFSVEDLITTPDAAPDASADCGAGGVRSPGGICYAAESSVSSWSVARASCRSRGAGWDLATVRSSQENDFLVALTGYEAWLGATDSALEGVWVWVLDDAPFFEVDSADAGVAFAPWNSGEPNNQNDSDCLRVLTTGLWADWACDDSKGHVCQLTVPSG
jgi:hypothetical protein